MNNHEAACEIVAREYDSAGLYGVGRIIRAGHKSHAHANLAVTAVLAALNDGVEAATHEFPPVEQLYSSNTAR